MVEAIGINVSKVEVQRIEREKAARSFPPPRSILPNQFPFLQLKQKRIQSRTEHKRQLVLLLLPARIQELKRLKLKRNQTFTFIFQEKVKQTNNQSINQSILLSYTFHDIKKHTI